MIEEMKFLEELNYIRTGGSKEELKAAETIAGYLKDLGLKPVIEDFKVQASTVKKVSLEVTKPYKKAVTCKAFSCSGNAEDLTGELYYYRGKDDSTCHDVKDKIVLFDRGLQYWAYKDILEQGAKGFIVCNGNLIADNEDIDERELREPLKKLGSLPGVAINISSAFEMIQNKATEVKMTTIQEESEANSRNVIVKIEGEKDPSIVFTAHYDSTALSHGMYDNATGAIGILKIAEYYATHKPKHNLIFVWCGSEERGLLGSKAYVEKHKEELKQIGLCINLDMIGCAMGGALACVTGEDKLVHYIEYLSKEKNYSIHSYQDVYSSDSTPFADNGIPAVSFARITQYSPIHCRYDEIGMLNEEMLKKDIGFILDFTRRMEEAEVLPVNRVIPENMKEALDYYLLRKRKEKK